MKPKIFIDGEHGTTGLQIRARLAERHDLDILSIPEEHRRTRQRERSTGVAQRREVRRRDEQPRRSA